MKASAITLLITTLFLLSSNAHAIDEPKNVTIGIGGYAQSVVFKNTQDDKFKGTAYSFMFSTENQIAFRATFYSADHDNLSALESDGYDLNMYAGFGLLSKGLKAYAGGGIFKETWNLPGLSQDFNGIQFSGGVGYNWTDAAIDFIVGIRDPSDYEDFFGSGSVDATVTTSVMFSLRI